MNKDQTYGSLTQQDDGRKERVGARCCNSPQKDTKLRTHLQSLNLKLGELKSIMDEFQEAVATTERHDSQQRKSSDYRRANRLEPGAADSILVYRLCSLFDFLQELYDFDDAGVFLCDAEGRDIETLALSSQSAGDESSGELGSQVRILWEKGDIVPAIGQEKRHILSTPEEGRFLVIPFRIMDGRDGFWVMYFRRNPAPGKESSKDMVLWTEIVSSCIESSCMMNLDDSPRGGDSDSVEREKVYTTTRMGRALTHEINNPLQVIMGRAQLLKMNRRKSSTPQTSEKILDAIESSAGKICSLVKNFSDYLHRQSTHIVDRGEVNLLHILKSDFPLIRYLLNSRRIKLETSLPGSLPSVFGNPGELEMAILSLIWELEGWLSSGGSISIKASAHDEYVRLDVHGEATEVPTENLDPACLVSCDRIGRACRAVEKSGGSLKLEDTSDQEVRFCMEFAVAPCEQSKGEPGHEDADAPNADRT